MIMANKNLFPKEATAVKTTKKAEKTKKEDKAKSQEKAEDQVAAPEEQEAIKAKPSKEKKKVKVTATKEKKPSMVDAALKVLVSAKEPMTCKDLVEAMATKGLWSSPSGKTPSNTLYSSFLRLIQNKGNAAPIRKADKGTFELNPSATA
jgi:hypothetical protein